VTVRDDAENHRFVYETEEGTAQLVYRVRGNRLVLAHTEVPEAMGGRGIGGKLVEAAVERARSSGETIDPQCPYARAWIEKHPDAVDGVAVDLGA
jgi:predicted GNAT family acetyltransferase